MHIAIYMDSGRQRYPELFNKTIALGHKLGRKIINGSSWLSHQLLPFMCGDFIICILSYKDANQSGFIFFFKYDGISVPFLLAKAGVKEDSHTGCCEQKTYRVCNRGGELEAFLCHQDISAGYRRHKGCREGGKPVKSLLAE